MKWLRQLGILLIFIVIVTVVLSMVLPTHQKIERTITINAPAKEVFKKIEGINNFLSFAVWFNRDSSIQYKTVLEEQSENGTRTPLNYTLWYGDPKISGEGKIAQTSSESGKYVKHQIHFIKPRKNDAESTITLNESNGVTTVTWEFILSTPRPWNIFNLLRSVDKEMGPDFEEGLTALKKSLEKTSTGSAAINTPEVQLLNFPATTFAIVRERVKWDDAGSFVAVNWDMLGRELKDSTAPKTATLVYERDEKSRQSDLAAAQEVAAGTKTENGIIQIIDIPASKAVYLDYQGAMINANEVYPLIRKYLSDNDLKQTGPIIEQLITANSNIAGWSSGPVRIIFLVE